MNLQYAYWHLAMFSPSPTPLAKPPHDEAPKAANDNYPVWPLIPFPTGWHASS
jgi:hypothetical protein